MVIKIQPVGDFYLKIGNKEYVTNASGLTYLWDKGSTESTIKKAHTKHFKDKNAI